MCLTCGGEAAISVARSFIPGSQSPVDKTIKETLMHHSQSQGVIGGGAMGISGLASKPDAYQRWIKTAHKRSKYVSATLNMANLLSEDGQWGKH